MDTDNLTIYLFTKQETGKGEDESDQGRQESEYRRA